MIRFLFRTLGLHMAIGQIKAIQKDSPAAGSTATRCAG